MTKHPSVKSGGGRNHLVVMVLTALLGALFTFIQRQLSDDRQRKRKRNHNAQPDSAHDTIDASPSIRED
jgi:hypothetical protein